ncbi:uncharacterized protein EV154DRAFT_526321, partial [Mucor mucedo]|uniref:uncharacterized protein n=1 Tax=Mucor mucedo TaxID=29922 RepID=UPI00221E894A
MYSYLEFGYLGPLVIYSFLTLEICFCLFKGTVYRSPITYTAFFAALSALICAIINAAVREDIDRIVSTRAAVSVFSIIYTHVAFVPGLIGFYRISKQKGSRFGTALAIIGCLWAFILIIIGIVYNVMIEKNAWFDSVGSYYVIVFGHVALAFILAILLALNHTSLHGKAKISLVAYTMLFILFEICYFIEIFAIHTVLALFVVSLIFNDLASAIALILSVSYGHLWITQNTLGDKVEISSEDNDYQH